MKEGGAREGREARRERERDVKEGGREGGREGECRQKERGRRKIALTQPLYGKRTIITEHNHRLHIEYSLATRTGNHNKDDQDDHDEDDPQLDVLPPQLPLQSNG